MPGESTGVLDCVVTHPAAALYAQGTSRQAGFAAAKAETSKRRAFELFGDGAGYECVLQRYNEAVRAKERLQRETKVKRQGKGLISKGKKKETPQRRHPGD